MDITTTRRQRVQAIIKERNLTLKAFADLIDRSQGQVSAIAGASAHKGIGNSLARHIELCLNLPNGFLDHPLHDENASVVTTTTRRLPVLGQASAGRVMENIQEAEIAEYVLAPGPTGPNAFALRIEGISMEPRFREGDKIVIDPDLEWKSGDFVYAMKQEENSGTFKQLRCEGEHMYLCATNESFEPRYTRINGEWTIVGKARWRVEDL
ncbi:LexA family protein [Halomonas elongata]|uniref:Peptidase S24 family protein n=1 Tax=Halomonas elongata (strain ATCC 33173 / DSM 2581 / NBRC 15536 / NCIMB 2198 / 1H9) TaxID=768066 RepID=A0A1R4A4I4_HALED|nr:S24 family peptidase [Halomonas elongata]WBF17842.1 S24 family peptidase [Halomonas elongata]WPU46687.1 S24 family peptidase [Halomonas elongata DSM 2581]SJK83887.1 peptidase S24 family protein [Halomonas elongata DSM 2581]